MSLVKNEMLEKEGIVRKVIYENSENGYVIFDMQTKEKEALTVVGYMYGIRVGESFKIRGNLKNHTKFGKQLLVESFEAILPTTCESILKYLTSGALKGIGQSLGKKIVEKFGEESLKIIENSPIKLSAIKGITKKSAERISKDYKESFNLRKTIIKLSEFNISTAEAIRAYLEHKEDILNLIKDNPYILCKSPVYVDFCKADSIFYSYKDLNQTVRIRAYLEYILDQNSKNKGHTCLLKEELINSSSRFINVSYEVLNKTLKELLDDGTFKKITKDEKDFIYKKEIFECEEYIAKKINTMLRFPAKNISKIHENISEIEKTNKINYAFLQKEAIKLASKNGMLILTGGPGTGKTITLGGIIKILKQKGERVLLVAPTGRAAQRMHELTGVKTKTIHRLLEATIDEKNKQIFKKNENNLLKCDAIIVDELSMVDIFMFKSLLSAIPIGARLIMVGDENQLPSVACGNVLSDLIKSNKICTIRLNKIFRQSFESLIVKNAHKIINSEKPILDVKNSDFFFLEYKNSEDVKRAIVDIYVNRLPKTYNFSSIKDIQVICPSKKGNLGTFELNSELQNAINPESKKKFEVKTSLCMFREGDKVMQTKNNYNLVALKPDGTLEEGVFNGDTGIVKKIDNLSKTITVNFCKKAVKYDFSQADELMLSYATTVHKSQGNEFCAVIIQMFDVPSQLCFRKLLYTSITRAKKLIVIVGKKEVLYKMMQDNIRTCRHSGLSFLLNKI